MYSISTSGSEAHIHFHLREPQLQVLTEMRRFNVLLAHRRMGKTVLAIVLLITKALSNPLTRPQYFYYCPTYSQAKKVAWEYLKEYAGLINATFNEAELKATLPNGAIIQLGSADNPDASRGLYLDGVVLDEPAQMPPSMWTQVLRPALSDRKGWALMIGTPAGRHGLFYESYQGAVDQDDWWRGCYKASETRIIDDEELWSARRDMSVAEYDQEYECSWDAAIKGAYWAQAMAQAETHGRIGKLGWSADREVHISLDLGMADATAAWFFQLDGNNIHLIDYAEYTNMGLPAIVQDWKARPYLYGKCIVPHDVQVRSLSTGLTRFETLRGLGVDPVQAPSVSIEDGIEIARNTLARCTFDADKCRDGIEALRQYRSDWQDKKGVLALKPLHDWASHGADSFRYLAISDLRSATSWSNDVFFAHKPERSERGYSRTSANSR